MPVSTFARPPLYVLASVGFAALALGGMLAVPLNRPPPLASIHAGAVNIDATDKPDLSRYQARDGDLARLSALSRRRRRGRTVAILAHGSSASSEEMNAIGKALAAAGVTAVAIDVRGHGASGTPRRHRLSSASSRTISPTCSTISAQPPRRAFPADRPFARRRLRRRRSRERRSADRFDRFVLLAPFLGPQAPTNRPNEGKRSLGRGRYAAHCRADDPAAGSACTFGQSLPVIAYANAPSAAKFVTSVYSFRLLARLRAGFRLGEDPEAALRRAAAKLTVIAGADDELMDAPAYERELRPLGVDVDDPARRRSHGRRLSHPPRSRASSQRRKEPHDQQSSIRARCVSSSPNSARCSSSGLWRSLSG